MTRKIATLAAKAFPVPVMGGTAVLFFLFKPHGAGGVFYFNLCYTLLLEAWLLAWLGFLPLPGKKSLPAPNTMTGIYSLVYVLAGITIMVAYRLVGNGVVDAAWYIAAILLITLLWLAPAFLMAKDDTRREDKQNEQPT